MSHAQLYYVGLLCEDTKFSSITNLTPLFFCSEDWFLIAEVACEDKSCDNVKKIVKNISLFQKVGVPLGDFLGHDNLNKYYIKLYKNLTTMKVSHIEHLGIAVNSLEEAIPYWENVLGLKCYAIEEVADQKVKTAFFMLGQTKIELLEPTSPESTIAKYIENKGVGIHHMALACENIEEQLADAEAHGIRLIDKTPRKGAEGLTIAFLHPKSTQGILTELCENKNK